MNGYCYSIRVCFLAGSIVASGFGFPTIGLYLCGAGLLFCAVEFVFVVRSNQEPRW